ncbi:MAG: beta-propeller fold lactonase family protein [Acidobacteria bacterium]|nr:beta-propeller fold lactonase family protein [Acidobacteriota bacterium]
MSFPLSRRAFLGASAAAAGTATIACWRKEKPGFAGFAFVANEEGSAIACVDLTAFAVVRHIPLKAAPTNLVSHEIRKTIYALTPSDGTIHELSTARLERERWTQLGGKALQMRLSPKGNALYVLLEEPKQLVEVLLDRMEVSRRFALPAIPADLDLARLEPRAIISWTGEATAGMLDLDRGKLHRIPTGSPIRIVRFRKDGRHWVGGHEQESLLSVFDTGTSKVVARLPLALKPRNICLKADEGQMFLTGEGSDAVAVIYPYLTEVAETVLAGHSPAAMAASYLVDDSPEFLFVANPESSQVTILNVNESYKLVSSVQVGAEPSFITLTPDNQCVLVLNRRSGDMAVLMVSNSKRAKQIPTLFTMIPVGSKPVSAVVQAV